MTDTGYILLLIDMPKGLTLQRSTNRFTDNLIFPIGIIAGGVVAALLAKKKMEE